MRIPYTLIGVRVEYMGKKNNFVTSNKLSFDKISFGLPTQHLKMGLDTKLGF